MNVTEICTHVSLSLVLKRARVAAEAIQVHVNIRQSARIFSRNKPLGITEKRKKREQQTNKGGSKLVIQKRIKPFNIYQCIRMQ